VKYNHKCGFLWQTLENRWSFNVHVEPLALDQIRGCAKFCYWLGLFVICYHMIHIVLVLELSFILTQTSRLLLILVLLFNSLLCWISSWP
jgi:hypothetical protein